MTGCKLRVVSIQCLLFISVSLSLILCSSMTATSICAGLFFLFNGIFYLLKKKLKDGKNTQICVLQICLIFLFILMRFISLNPFFFYFFIVTMGRGILTLDVLETLGDAN